MKLKDSEISSLIDIVREAHKEILNVYNSDDFNVEIKGDNSPLTRADKKSNDIIIEGLQNLFPNIPILSEEEIDVPFKTRKEWPLFWLIDPLDGTKEFIKRNDEFTTNIALISNCSPILGVIGVPIDNSVFVGYPGSFCKKINQSNEEINLSCRRDDNLLRVMVSRSHMSEETNTFLKEQFKGREIETIAAGSSLKFCKIAEGLADIYPRLGPTMEWDTGAAQAVLNAAGGKVMMHNTTKQLMYNKENLLNPYFIASSPYISHS